MARPTKSASVSSGKIGKDEKKSRIEQEQKLRGTADNITPPEHLNDRQKDIFYYVVDELKTSGILGNLDTYVLSTFCISVDRIQTIEEAINRDPEKLYDRVLMSAKDKYTKDFFRCCNELSLSPQARAKIGNINSQAAKEETDPLLKVLSGGLG